MQQLLNKDTRDCSIRIEPLNFYNIDSAKATFLCVLRVICIVEYSKDEWETLIKDNEETLDPFIKTLLTAYKDGHENFEYDEKTYNTSIVLERHINELSNK